jgi:hypothetical protein
MTDRPEHEEFQKQIENLKRHPAMAGALKRGIVTFKSLSLESVHRLIKDEPGYYFLIAAAGLNRTSLKKAAAEHEASIVEPAKRRAFAIRKRLPIAGSFADVASGAIALRKGDLNRRSRGAIEQLFRDRLAAEGIGLLMSPPSRQVPGLLVGKRKPDGVFPDPAAGHAPTVYLEIKNVNRVSDDIQKRLYEIAEASLEMKFLYGSLKLDGLNVRDPREVALAPEKFRRTLRDRIVSSKPTTVALFLCPKAEADKYRAGAEAFIDRLFFQEEIDECLVFLKSVVGIAEPVP